MKINLHLHIALVAGLLVIFSFPSLHAQSSTNPEPVDVVAINQISARDILREYRTVSRQKIADESAGSTILIYEGFQQEMLAVSDDIAHDEEAAKTQGLYTGSILKWVKVGYVPSSAAIERLDNTSIAELNSLFAASERPVEFSSKSDNLVFGQDIYLKENRWFLDAPFGMYEPLTVAQAAKVLADNHKMYPSSLDALVNQCGDEVITPPKGATVREVLIQLLHKLAEAKEDTMAFQVLPLYTADNGLAWFQEYPEPSAIEGWVLQVF